MNALLSSWHDVARFRAVARVLRADLRDVLIPAFELFVKQLTPAERDAIARETERTEAALKRLAHRSAPHFGEDELLLHTPAEAAKFLNSSPRTLARWRVEGNGPLFVKVGRRVHYRRAHLEAWLTKRERWSTSESVFQQTSNDAAQAGGR